MKNKYFIWLLFFIGLVAIIMKYVLPQYHLFFSLISYISGTIIFYMLYMLIKLKSHLFIFFWELYGTVVIILNLSNFDIKKIASLIKLGSTCLLLLATVFLYREKTLLIEKYRVLNEQWKKK